jgi:hypothetical protein
MQGRGWSIVQRILHPAAAALVAGLVAGAVASGGARIAMRIAGAVADPCTGLVTENGNACGVFTVGGTFGLIFFGAVFTGVPGAIVYAALSPWLRPLLRWRGVVFGLLATAALGFVVLDPGNVDFDRFGPPALNIATFSALFILFGMVVGPVFDLVERRLPQLPPRRPVRPASLVGYGLLAFTVVPIVAISIASLGLGVVVLAFLAFVHELGEAVARARGRGELRPALRAAYAIPLILLGGGAFLTASAIFDIVR